MLSNIIRRLRDTDSTVRSTCVNAVAAMSSQITKPPFTSFLKPFTEALFTEQDHNSQIGVALCLASAIEASPDPDPAQLRKLLPRFEKLLKCESFKAKPALLTLIGSVVEVGGASTVTVLKNLVPCVMEFLSSEDWAARKAAADVLAKLAVEERDALSDFKASCLKTFESRRFDKVKVVRDTMNQMLEAWKEVPDLSDEVSPPPRSQSSSKENASDGRYPPGSNNFCAAGSEASQMRKKQIPASRSPPPDGSSATTARKRSPLKSSDKNTGLALFQKLDRKKPSNWKIEISVPHGPSLTGVYQDDVKGRDENVVDRRENEKIRFSKPETKRVLFTKNSDDKTHKFGGFRSGSRVVPCQESSESTVVVSNATKDLNGNHKECEDLSLIRKQLVQIENQQSSLLDLLQRFIGNSQNGMRSLETRVHGLEQALDEISFDLAVSNGRMKNTESAATTCCMLPGADFLSSKFWRKTEGRYTTSRFSSSGGNPSTSAMRYLAADKNGSAETFKLENRRFQAPWWRWVYCESIGRGQQ
ncbi:hypothetical protein L1049_027987 [Liquidambar formosana]|uniref:TORTIFOLIA1/SINE1-2 N-terminal domain-containing protein n=1 Tax=Liquidambar formosana TaxID=63359 RepID=A0AAP0WSY8_LIQFO